MPDGISNKERGSNSIFANILFFLRPIDSPNNFDADDVDFVTLKGEIEIK